MTEMRSMPADRTDVCAPEKGAQGFLPTVSVPTRPAVRGNEITPEHNAERRSGEAWLSTAMQNPGLPPGLFVPFLRNTLLETKDAVR